MSKLEGWLRVIGAVVTTILLAQIFLFAPDGEAYLLTFAKGFLVVGCSFVMGSIVDAHFGKSDKGESL